MENISYITSLFSTSMYAIPWAILGVYLLKKHKTSGILLLIHAFIEFFGIKHIGYLILNQQLTETGNFNIVSIIYSVIEFLNYIILLVAFIILVRRLDRLQKEKNKKELIDEIGR